MLALGLVVAGSATTHLNAAPGGAVRLLLVLGCWKVMANLTGPVFPFHGPLQTGVGTTLLGSNKRELRARAWHGSCTSKAACGQQDLTRLLQ